MNLWPLLLISPSHLGRLTIVVEYFFQSDLEFLKSSDLKKKYTTSNEDQSNLKILSVVSVKVERLHSYGHLDEIVVRRADRQLYKFKGDFVDLHLHDIEDILLLAVQHKLFQLNGKRYQKKLNITKPQKTFPGIEFKELYTPSYKPPGAIYEDMNKQKRVMRVDGLYKFLDGTLKTIHGELHHRVLNFLLGYNKEMNMRKWSAIDKKRSELMVELIDN
ncbi:hypothetical protein Tco_0321956 [Tanacetum coccineum]